MTLFVSLLSCFLKKSVPLNRGRIRGAYLDAEWWRDR
jgi:hypothetical protein